MNSEKVLMVFSLWSKSIYFTRVQILIANRKNIFFVAHIQKKTTFLRVVFLLTCGMGLRRPVQAANVFLIPALSAQLVELVRLRRVRGSESLCPSQRRHHPSRTVSFFIQAAGSAYHHDAVVHIISPSGCISSRTGAYPPTAR